MGEAAVGRNKCSIVATKEVMSELSSLRNDLDLIKQRREKATYVVGVIKKLPACIQFMRAAVIATLHFFHGASGSEATTLSSTFIPGYSSRDSSRPTSP